MKLSVGMGTRSFTIFLIGPVIVLYTYFLLNAFHPRSFIVEVTLSKRIFATMKLTIDAVKFSNTIQLKFKKISHTISNVRLMP
jgi:hypothetical protein